MLRSTQHLDARTLENWVHAFIVTLDDFKKVVDISLGDKLGKTLLQSSAQNENTHMQYRN
jgi:hypothetical protein